MRIPARLHVRIFGVRRVNFPEINYTKTMPLADWQGACVLI